MIIGEKVQYFDKKSGEMKPFMYYEHTYKTSDLEKPIRKWYRMHPYAKRISKHWICNDYRIDQQRPQRNVYSERYLKIVQMTEMEEKFFDKLIKDIEKDINYPTVWDDGKTRHYEDTIHCPNCGERRKVLTSKTHCEFCGFAFSKFYVKKCPKCKDLNLIDEKVCRHCGYDFNSKIGDEVKHRKSPIICSECEKKNNPNNNYCVGCNHKLKKIDVNDEKYRQYCEYCGNQLKKEDKYCCECGKKVIKKILKVKICPVCGKWCNSNEYCWNCGHNNKENPILMKCLSKKECGNCKSYYDDCYQYCNMCGAKLKNRRKNTIEEFKKGQNAFKNMQMKNNKYYI